MTRGAAPGGLPYPACGVTYWGEAPSWYARKSTPEGRCAASYVPARQGRSNCFPPRATVARPVDNFMHTGDG